MKAGEVANKYGLDEVMGVRLLHQHTQLGEEEIMVEDYGQFEGKQALISEPKNIRGHIGVPVPASWILQGDRYIAFEYTLDPNVQTIFKNLIESGENFFQEISLLIKKYHFENLLAPAIIDRMWYEDFKGETLFVEKSYEESGFKSVVQPALDDLPSRENMIKTAWLFTTKPIHFGCLPIFVCASYNGGHYRMSAGHRGT